MRFVDLGFGHKNREPRIGRFSLFPYRYAGQATFALSFRTTLKQPKLAELVKGGGWASRMSHYLQPSVYCKLKVEVTDTYLSFRTVWSE